MTRILHNPTTGEFFSDPRADDQPIVGLQPPLVVLVVIQHDAPSYDPATQRLEAAETLDLEGGTVTRSWQIVPVPTPVPTPDWVAFYGALNEHPVTGPAVEEALRQLVPPSPSADMRALGGLYVGLGQASAGDSRVFLATWQRAADSGLLSAELITGAQELATACHLPAEFIAALQPQLPGGDG